MTGRALTDGITFYLITLEEEPNIFICLLIIVVLIIYVYFYYVLECLFLLRVINQLFFSIAGFHLGTNCMC